MSTTIEYKDDFGNLISGKQAAQLENHNELLLEDGVQVLKKSFYKKTLDYVTFYNPQNLSNSDAINLISQDYPLTPFDIVSETPMGNYKMRTYLAHDVNANYDGKHIELVDQNDYIICLEEYDENDALENVTKYALNSNGGEIIFRYSRFFDRSLQSVSGVAGNSFNENVSISDFEINYPNFLNTHPYYQDGTFLP
jgi:hypothetical protein